MSKLDRFYLDRQTIVDGDVETQRLFKTRPLYSTRTNFLSRCRNRTQFQLASHASLVDRLDSSRAFVPHNFYCRPDDFPAELVRLVVKSMHRRRFYTEAKKKYRRMSF